MARLGRCSRQRQGPFGDRDRARRLLRRKRSKRARGYDDVDPGTHQCADKCRESIGVIGQALLNDEVAAQTVPERAEPALERSDITLGRCPEAQKADAARMLRASYPRSCC